MKAVDIVSNTNVIKAHYMCSTCIYKLAVVITNNIYNSMTIDVM